MSTTTDPRPDGPVLADRPEPGAPRAYEFPAVTGRTLSNGLSLVVADLPGRPLVSASLILTGGSVEEPADLGGAMVLAARALTEGTARHDAIALTEAAERLGASLHAEAGWDALTVGVDVPASRLEPALELVAEVLLEATFPESEVERLRDERLNDLLQAQADPRRRVEEAFVGTIYAAEAPYHRPSGGTRDTVERLTAEALRATYQRTLRPERATLVVGGDLAGLDVDGDRRAPLRIVGRIGRRQRVERRWRDRRHRDVRRAARPRDPPTGLRPDGDPGRTPRPAPSDRRLPRRLGDERDPRRPVQLAPQHEAARGEGLHVRRGSRVRHAPRRRSVLRSRRRQHRGHRAGDRRHAGRADPDA